MSTRFNELLRDLWRRCRERFEERLRPFEIALGQWLNATLARPDNWREGWAAFVEDWKAQGVVVSPEGYRAIEELLERMTGERPVAVGSASARPVAAPSVTAAPKASGVSPSWPVSTPAERERTLNEYGLPSWYPFKPIAPGDSNWEEKLAGHARTARARLLDFFRALEAMGAQSKRTDGDGDDGLDALSTHGRQVRAAYDDYLMAFIVLHRQWLAYLERHWILGIHVQALMNKLETDLPASLFGLHSRHEPDLLALQADITKASNALTDRVEIIHTTAVWADRVIEAVTLLGGITVVAKAAAVKAVAAGASKAAARNLAIKVAVKELVVQVGMRVAIGKLVPPALEAAGLNEAEIAAGLAVLELLPQLHTLRQLHSADIDLPAKSPFVVGSGKQAPSGIHGALPHKPKVESSKSAGVDPPAIGTKHPPDHVAAGDSATPRGSTSASPPATKADADTAKTGPEPASGQPSNAADHPDPGASVPATSPRDKSWKDLIEGKAQKTQTPGHQVRSIREAIRMAKSGLYDKVWMNRSYSTTTGTRTAPRRLPDVIGRRKTGEYDAIEVPSKSNSPLELYIRNREALDQLPRAQRGRIRIKTILKSQKNDQ